MNRREFLQSLWAGAVSMALPNPNLLFPSSTETWRPPSIEQMRTSLTSEAFLRASRIDRPLFTRQFDPTEYNKIDKSYASIRNNSCGLAVVASALKIYGYFETGKSPAITIQSVRDTLQKNQYFANGKKRNYIEWNNGMYLSSVKAALDLASETYHIKTTEFSSVPLQGFTKDKQNFTHLMTGKQITSLVEEAQPIFAKGGMVTAFVDNYNGHFVLFSNMVMEKSGPRVFVIDSRGFGPNYLGIVQDTPLSNYGVDLSFGPAVFSAFGIYPAYR